VPSTLSPRLAALGPRAGPGVRLAAGDDLHVTLHFLGNCQTPPAAAALASVRAGALTIELTAPGSFDLRGGRRILWVGVRPSPPLLALHEQVGAALSALGFRPETRPFRPHITLARLAARAARSEAPMPTLAQLPPAARSFVCRQFALYASRTTAGGPRYRIVRAYPLGA
jgi:2'-5' RNA ligase